MAIDHFSSSVFTLAAAIRDRKPRLYVAERGAPAFDRFSDLTVADAVAKTNVHGENTLGGLRRIQIQMRMIVNQALVSSCDLTVTDSRCVTVFTREAS